MTCLGPILRSYLIQFSWRYIFFINIPLAIIAILMITKLVPSQVRDQAHRPIDWRGGIIVALAMITLIIPLQQSRSLGWTNSLVWGPVCSCHAVYHLYCRGEKNAGSYYKTAGFLKLGI